MTLTYALFALALLAIAGVVVAPELKARRRNGMFAAKSTTSSSLADYLPYRTLVRPAVVKNVNGSYLAAWRIAGRDVGAIGDADILNSAYQVAATIGALQAGTVTQLYARRVPFREYDRALGADHPVLAVLDDLRASFFLSTEKVYRTERTLTLTWQPPSANAERARAAVSAGADAQRRNEDQTIVEFEALCDRVESALAGAVDVKRLGGSSRMDAGGITRHTSDLMQFVASCVTGEDKPFTVPPPGMPLNGLLSTDVVGGFAVRVGRDEISCIEIKSFPDEVMPRILDKLTELKVAHLFVIRIVAQSIAASRSELRGAVVDFRGAANFNSGFVDPDAMAASEQAVAAYGSASGDYTRVGRVSIVLVLRAPTRELATKAQRDVIGVLENAGFRGLVRDVGAFETWLSSLPSDASHGTRKYPLSALAVAKLFPMHESSMGRRYADSESLPERTPALTYALRPGNTLYRVHLNVADLFHGFGIGKSSSGKSVMATYLAMAFRSRFPVAGITTIDNGRSARPGCLMVDGQYHDILGPASPGFALFRDAGDPEVDRERLDILEEMVELQRGSRVTPEQHESLASANRTIASLPAEHRSMSAFYDLVQDPDGSLRPALLSYTRRGVLGATFDASEDSFDVSRFNVIDVARVMGLPPKYLVPILRVLVWKTLSQIRRMKADLGPRGRDLHWLISIDEAHAIMRHPIGARFILELQKMGRKENVAIWLWSNALSEFASHPDRNDLLMQSPSRIYFGDSAATESDIETLGLYKNLQLPARGIAMVPNLPSRSFLLHQPDARVLVELNLRLDREALAIVGTSRMNDDVDRFRRLFPTPQYGEHTWKIHMLRSEGATNAADRLERLCIAREMEVEQEPSLVIAG